VLQVPTTPGVSDDLRQAGHPEFVTLLMPHGWADLFGRHNLPQLERDVIPAFLPRQRWWALKGRKCEAAWVLAYGELAAPAPESGGSAAGSFLIQIVQAQLADDEPQLYMLPLAAVWGSGGSETRQNLLPASLAELRQSRREGALVDALMLDDFGLALFEAVKHEANLPLHNAAGGTPGELRFRHTPLFAETPPPERLVARRLGAEQSNSSVLYEDYAMLKLYRRLQPGPHPEVEMTRFLVERAGFANTPPPLATIELTLPGASGNDTCAAGVLCG